MSPARALSLLAIAIVWVWGLPLPAAPNTAQDSPLTAVMQSDRFIVHYDPVDPFLARLAAETAADELSRIADELGYTLESGRPFDLYVYRSHRDFIRGGGLAKRKFTVGIASLADQSIAVDASGAFVILREVLAHEITHAVTFRLLGHHSSKLPLWFTEGIAKHYSESSADADDRLIAQAAAEGVLMPLWTLTNDFPDQREPLAYAESASAIRHLVRHFGESSPKSILAELRQGKSFDQAMSEVTGLTSRRFADEWYAGVSERFRILRIVRIGGALVGVLMAVLAAAAFAVRRRRMILAARQWEEEELAEAIRRQQGNDWHM